MNNCREILVWLAKRLLLAAVLFGIGWLVMPIARHGRAAVPQLLLGISLMTTAAMIIAFPIARLIVHPSISRFHPSDESAGLPPMYSIPESRRKSGFYEEAMAAFQEIAEKHPEEVKPWIEMIDIAIMDLKDPDRALAVYRKGMNVLTEERDQRVLAAMYEGISSRLGARDRESLMVAFPAKHTEDEHSEDHGSTTSR